MSVDAKMRDLDTCQQGAPVANTPLLAVVLVWMRRYCQAHFVKMTITIA